jgi:nitroreductase
MMDLMTQRRSIRKYDASVKIARSLLNEMLMQAMKAPSSKNMQPWRFLVIDTEEGKAKLAPALLGNENQLKTSAAMIVLFQDLKKYDLYEKILDMQLTANLITLDDKIKNLNYQKEKLPQIKTETIEREGLIDGGLVAMQLMLVAKYHGFDTCPIGGFNRETINDAVGFDKNRYKPVMIISIGKAADSGRVTLRLPLEDTVFYL